MRLNYTRLVAVVVILTSLISMVSPVFAAAGDKTTATTISAVPTYENIGVVVGYSGDNNQNNSATLEYRLTGGTWKTAPQMYSDRTNKQYRGSIFWLTPNTDYEVKVTIIDTDGGGSLTTTTKTRN